MRHLVQVVNRYLEHLLKQGEVDKAASLCPGLLKVACQALRHLKDSQSGGLHCAKASDAGASCRQ